MVLCHKLIAISVGWHKTLSALCLFSIFPLEGKEKPQERDPRSLLLISTEGWLQTLLVAVLDTFKTLLLHFNGNCADPVSRTSPTTADFAVLLVRLKPQGMAECQYYLSFILWEMPFLPPNSDWSFCYVYTCYYTFVQKSVYISCL